MRGAIAASWEASHCAAYLNQEARIARAQREAVGRRDGTQRRSRSRSRRVHLGRSGGDCSVLETIRRSERASQGSAVSVGHVDARVLHQPGGKGIVRQAQARIGARQGRIARSVRALIAEAENDQEAEKWSIPDLFAQDQRKDR